MGAKDIITYYYAVEFRIAKPIYGLCLLTTYRIVQILTGP